MQGRVLNRVFKIVRHQVNLCSKPLVQHVVLDDTLLRTVVSHHEKNGHRFLIPFGDRTVVQKILEPLRQLNLEGVKVEFLVDALYTDPNLFEDFSKNGKRLCDLLDLLVGCCSFTFESALRFYSGNIDVLRYVKPEEVSCRLHVFTHHGILVGPELGRMVRRCPHLLSATSAEQMAETIETLSSFFSRKQVTKVIIQSPEVVLLPSVELKQKYEYIYFQMRLEPEDLVESTNWLNLDLEEIVDRHEFLLKSGRYALPDPKRPQIKKDNPSSCAIFDSDEVNFSHQTARVTHPEWNAFKCLKLQQRQLSQQHQPFDRVKLSKRKAYERRPKSVDQSFEVLN